MAGPRQPDPRPAAERLQRRAKQLHAQAEDLHLRAEDLHRDVSDARQRAIRNRKSVRKVAKRQADRNPQE